MPVQRRVVDCPEMLRAKLTAQRAAQQPGEGDDAGDHVDTVQAGHEKVDAEEDAEVARLLWRARWGLLGFCPGSGPIRRLRLQTSVRGMWSRASRRTRRQVAVSFLERL